MTDLDNNFNKFRAKPVLQTLDDFDFNILAMLSSLLN